MIIFYVFTALLFILLGVLIYHLKMYDLIAGYNTMKKDQREKVDIESTAKAMGLFFYVNAFVFIVLLVLESLSILSLQPMIVLGYFLISVVSLVVFIQRYDNH